MTSNKDGDDSVTDVAASDYEVPTDDSAALSWAGDDTLADVGRAADSPIELDTELVPAPEAGAESIEAEPAPVAIAEPEPAPAVGPEADEPEQPAREPLSNAMLVIVGLLAGIYLLYSIGWYIGAGRIDSARGTLLTDVGFHAAFWLAVALPPLWFAASMLGTRKKWTRLAALLIGVVLCIPWPFVMVGALGV